MPIHYFMAKLAFCNISSAVITQTALKLPEIIKTDPTTLNAEPICDPIIEVLNNYT